MPIVNFTARSVDAIRPPSSGQAEYWDETLPGFGLRVSFGGTKAWFVKYRTHGRFRRLALGSCPAVGLADARHDAKKAVARIRRSLGFDFRGHDLRRTAASLMTSAGVSRLVVAKVLNHAETEVSAVYDRHSYDAEKRAAFDLWDRELKRILRKKRDRAVLPFQARQIPA